MKLLYTSIGYDGVLELVAKDDAGNRHVFRNPTGVPIDIASKPAALVTIEHSTPDAGNTLDVKRTHESR